MHLKMPPERAELIADVIETEIEHTDDYLEIQKLTEISTWLRYRIQRWRTSHPADPTT